MQKHLKIKMTIKKDRNLLSGAIKCDGQME